MKSTTFVLVPTIFVALSSALVASPKKRDNVADENAIIASASIYDAAWQSSMIELLSSMAEEESTMGGGFAAPTGSPQNNTNIAITTTASATSATIPEAGNAGGDQVTGFSHVITTATPAPIVATTLATSASEISSASGSVSTGGVSRDSDFVGNACGISTGVDSDTDPVVAIPQAIYDATRTHPSGPSTLCGKTLSVIPINGGAPVVATIVERCGPGCSVPNGLDLSNYLYKEVTGDAEQPGPTHLPATWYLN